MDPSEGFARPSDDDPTAAFEKDLGQVNRHLAMQTVLLQSLVQAAAGADGLRNQRCATCNPRASCQWCRARRPVGNRDPFSRGERG